jgi:two-component system response regulator ResD
VTQTTILIVDDEPIVRDVVARYLENDGYGILEASDGDDARAQIEVSSPSLVVLDVMLPGTDGLTLCRWIRKHGGVPVIMLTARGGAAHPHRARARGAVADRIVALDLGADDYMTKPFSPRELAARVRSVLRRTTAGPAQGALRLELDGLVIDPETRDVTLDGGPVQLTAKEFDLLFFLASHPRHVFSRDQLMSRVWGYAAAFDTGTVTVHIRRLRSKIEVDPARPTRLETVWGVGYRFVA